MLSARDAFKVGFLARCVEDGLSSTQMLDRVKQASDLMEKGAFLGSLIGSAFDKTLDAGKSVAHGLMGYGIPLALAAPPIMGGMAGYGLARATDIDDTDVDDIKNREVINEYKRQTQELLRQRAMRDYQKHRKQTGRVFM